MKRAIERAAIVADPVGAVEAAVVAKQNEFLSFTPTEDGVEVRGFLAWDTAGVVLPCFDQAHDALYRNGQLAEDYSDDAELERLDDAGPRAGAGSVASTATRRSSPSSRPACSTTASSGPSTPQRPHLTVTVHADDFAAGLGGDLLLPGFGSVPVPNETIERFLCDAEIHPVLTRRPRPAAPGSPTTGSAPGRSGGCGLGHAANRSVPGQRPRARRIRRGDHRWRPRPTGGWEHDLTRRDRTRPPRSSRPTPTSPR